MQNPSVFNTVTREKALISVLIFEIYKIYNMKKLTYSLLLCLTAAIGLTGCGSQPQQADETKKDSAAAAPDSSSVTSNWKIGVQLWTFHYVPFVTAIAKADSAGVKYLEAFPGQALGGDMKDSFGIRMSAESKAKIKQLLQSKGISIVAMGVIVPRTIDEWKKYFDLAKEFGLSYITSEPLKDQWDAIDSLAGVYGIKVAIHDHPRPNAYWHPDSVLAAVKGHPNIGSCADVGHWARNGLDPARTHFRRSRLQTGGHRLCWRRRIALVYPAGGRQPGESESGVQAAGAPRP